MRARTVNWTTLRNHSAPNPSEGLRERKKRLTRQQLSDTATEMFLERGFDAVRVTEIAQACNVSEKTVFNYFPTKESLVLDLEEPLTQALTTALANHNIPPLKAVLQILDDQTTALTSWLADQENPTEATNKFHRFTTLIHTTPSLQAHQRDLVDKLTTTTTQLLATRNNKNKNDPEPRITATALLGLWQIQSSSLNNNLNKNLTPTAIAKAVTKDVHRAAKLLETGLKNFATNKTTYKQPTT